IFLRATQAGHICRIVTWGFQFREELVESISLDLREQLGALRLGPHFRESMEPSVPFRPLMAGRALGLVKLCSILRSGPINSERVMRRSNRFGQVCLPFN